jgi:hypothetical protein
MAPVVEVDAAVAGGGEVAVKPRPIMKAQLIDIGGINPHERIAWYCPGCKCHHGVPVPPHAGAWSWNSSLNEPTLDPSVVIQRNGSVCHSFIRDGKIMFLGDCTHALAGKTVEMRAVEMEEFE